MNKRHPQEEKEKATQMDRHLLFFVAAFTSGIPAGCPLGRLLCSLLLQSLRIPFAALLRSQSVVLGNLLGTSCLSSLSIALSLVTASHDGSRRRATKSSRKKEETCSNQRARCGWAVGDSLGLACLYSLLQELGHEMPELPPPHSP